MHTVRCAMVINFLLSFSFFYFVRLGMIYMGMISLALTRYPRADLPLSAAQFGSGEFGSVADYDEHFFPGNFFQAVGYTLRVLVVKRVFTFS